MSSPTLFEPESLEDEDDEESDAEESDFLSEPEPESPSLLRLFDP